MLFVEFRAFRNFARLRMMMSVNQRAGLPFRSIDTREQLRTDPRAQNDNLAGG